MTQAASAPIAPIPRRAIAFVIDAFIAAGLTIVLWGGLLVAATLAGSQGMLTTLLIGAPIVSLVLLAWFVVYTLMQAGKGSIGMRAQGLKLVSAADQSPLGFGRTLLRNIIFGLASSIVVGYFTPLFDGSGRFQGWHDKVARSLMLDARGAASGAPLSSAAPATPEVVASAPPVAPAAAAAPHPVASAAPVAGVAATPAFPAAPSAPAPIAPADDSLIAFVPGISQDAPPPRVTPVPPAAGGADLDATVQGYAAARPAAPSAPSAPSASPVSPPQAPTAPVAAPVPASAPLVAAPVAARRSDDSEVTRISVPGHRLVFTWDDGTRVSVSGRTIFGRNPAPEDGAVVVQVRDETLSLSKTHFEAAGESSGGWVLDRHSTNGMTLIREGRRIACPAGQRVPVRLGDAIEIGDRIVTIGGYA